MLAVEGITVSYGDQIAVQGVSFDVRSGEQLSVLGPSGSGKSTALRAIAGLEPLVAGRVSWDGRDLGSVPVHLRGFGLMFQDYVLFPHLDVAANVGFGLASLAIGRPERKRRVDEALDLVGLRGYESRLPAQLSGGEQQRVALARSLAPRPRLLMLDEPLGALDRGLRRALLEQLTEIFSRLETPVIYVTHDHEEALAVGDRVAVMRHGRVEAVSPPSELWQRPPSEFVARFLGLTNIVAADVVDGHAHTELGTFPLTPDALRTRGSPLPTAGRWGVLLRPDAFRLASDGGVAGVVHSTTFRGDHTLLRVDVLRKDAPELRLEIEIRESAVPAVGDHVRFAVDPAGVVLLPLT